jgi:hypothetical protein
MLKVAKVFERFCELIYLHLYQSQFFTAFYTVQYIKNMYEEL